MILQAEYDKDVVTLEGQSQVQSQTCQFKISCSCKTCLKSEIARLHLAWHFKISKSTVTRYLIIRTNFCYFSLGAISIRPSGTIITKYQKFHVLTL